MNGIFSAAFMRWIAARSHTHPDSMPSGSARCGRVLRSSSTTLQRFVTGTWIPQPTLS
jgi:hypothetical protein